MKNYYLILCSVAICLSANAQELSTTMTVKPGSTVYVSSGTTLAPSNLNLKSRSNSYAILLLKGDLGASTIVNYDRHVNKVGQSGVNGGNDLISMPVKVAGDATFVEFLDYSNGSDINSDVLANSTTLYAFGPYNNSNQSYTNYDAVANAAALLERGVGYRAAATNSGQTLRFTGTVSTVTETVEISTSNNYWNGVGNPYPTFIDSQKFLTENSIALDPNATAVYGYNSGTNPEVGSGTFGNFTVINNLTNTDVNIAPGQGFLVANAPDNATHQINFTTAMQTSAGTDDFILGRTDNEVQKLRLRAQHATGDFATEIYFNGNSTLGLDPGYDAALFNGVGGDFFLYSQLVENNQGRNMAIQSLGSNDLNDITIPLGLKTAQGKQVTFSIETSTLPETIDVYLEDNQTNTFTLLNASEYTFTANSNISGTGRFFLRIGNSTLSNIVPENGSLQIFASKQTLFVNGPLLSETKVSIYDIQGRLVMTSFLDEASDLNKIDASALNTGIYVVKLNNEAQQQTKKVIFK
ncbi:T9SS type A sorting domain-containing protein [Subsaximicrobium wynnwilliamsii]|uniref:T9SS type A sorting domain-containing protein n=1 Tax=Subsaximicrobium wynnwilliamsii TaxID=291179 RepID=A0A5C6ZJ15_9FLAO|nr:T9SS type A sorting domain-containing protein [Subsaximicrobium wynnwilliamsii]TXD84282.1 T9SS type A sorting domain-containing protein [Subsaximicrobium wynnwilliamsii]TXD89903.1 T9SS type A sorting domain-containing protein [Subsaximicrobium wynnwilliamsii]TXE03994.1 T9SS type A sorting domain-containing protein [Subsaximicrobium wynnwilliamsii]